MAQKVEVKITSDLSGAEGASTLTYGLDGQVYEIDLTEKEAGKFRGFLAEYVGHSRKAGKTAFAKRPRGERVGPDPRDVREWAAANGVEVGPRGRIPAEIIEKYEASFEGLEKSRAKA